MGYLIAILALVLIICFVGIDLWIVILAGIGLLIMVVSKAPPAKKRYSGGYKKSYSGKRYNGSYRNNRRSSYRRRG
jgi:hypothetical protein